MTGPWTLPDSIGESEEGRLLSLLHAGAAGSPLRVLIVAGQHGDEGRSRKAVEEFVAAHRASPSPRVWLAAVPNLNPDGAIRKQRPNARGVDLNRDHQLLAAAETRALHTFVRRWRPHLVVDVHTYPPRRKRLLAHHLIHCHSIFLDAANNPTLPLARLPTESPDVLPAMLDELNARGHRSGRYTLATASGKVRHSTPDVVDARNGLALRCGIHTLLIEARKPTRADGPADRAHLGAALRAALEVVVRWAERREERLTTPSADVAANRVAIRSRRVRSDRSCVLPFLDVRSGDVRDAEVPGDYYPSLKVTRRVSLPAAYAVPRTHPAVIEVLHRHGFPSHAGSGTGRLVERYRLCLGPRTGRRPRLVAEIEPERRSLADYVVFAVTPDGGAALAAHLEPRSKYGLHRYAEMNLTPQPDSHYPVLRVTGHPE